MSNLRHQLTKVKMDIHNRLLDAGHSDQEAEVIIEEMQLLPADQYAYIEHLDVEYRWTTNSHSITDHSEN